MKTQALQEPEPRTAWAGWDVAKETFQAALWIPGEDGRRRPGNLPTQSFPRTQKGVAEFLSWADEKIDVAWSGMETAGPGLRVVMEATGPYSEPLAVWLLVKRPTASPAIISPDKTKSYAISLGLRNKTDKVDARCLAQYGAERGPAAYEPPTPERRKLRALSRNRIEVQTVRIMEELILESVESTPLTKRLARKRIKLSREHEEMLEKEMKQCVKESPDLAKDIKELDAIYGVGFLTAATVVAELGDLRRFEKARQLTSYVGLAPFRWESGKSVKGRTRMSKRGNSWVRRALYMSAMSATRGDNDLADCYKRMQAHGKKDMEALGVVMRKLLVLMRAVLISGEPFEAHHVKKSAKPVEKPADQEAKTA